jgi:PhnB protein
MRNIVPILGFNGNCREAMTFYQQCLGGTLQLMAGRESPAADHLSAEMRDGIMHAHLESGSATLMGTDMMGANLKPGNGITLSPWCNSEEEVHRVFNALAEGGHIDYAPRVEFWGGLEGRLTDKFGQAWTIVHSKELQ